ncbi:DUF6350 family protein [Georgenia sp. AZ-5]|uniref:cell division protein PerM n=1 Tax=Georgenia sp. AZ-5 TaxID=3367526 RepID=UPI003754ADBC
MPTTTEPTVPRVIEVPTLRPRRGVPEGWLRGLVAGLESAVMGWLAVAVPAIATYVATAAAPALGEATWQAAAGVGTSLWFLGHGGALLTGPGTTMSVVPLGVTLLSLALVYGAARRMRLRSVGAGAFVPAGYLLAALVLFPFAAVPVAPLQALLGVVALPVVGTVLALRGRVPAPAWWARLRGAPDAVTAGLAGALRAGAALLALAVVLAAVAAVTGWDRLLGIQAGYAPDAVSAVVMVMAQLIFVPTLLAWVVAWLAGPGFAVGAGTVFSPAEVVTAPLPALPVLGLLPSPASPEMGWAVLAPVLVGAAVGVWLDRRRRRPTLPGALASAAVAAGATALGVLLLAAAASGSVGPGRMAVVGPEPLLLTALVLAEVGGGAALAVVALHPRTAEAVRTAVEAARTRTGHPGDGAGASGAGAETRPAGGEGGGAEGPAAEDAGGGRGHPDDGTAGVEDADAPVGAGTGEASGTALPGGAWPSTGQSSPAGGAGGWRGPRLSDFQDD